MPIIKITWTDSITPGVTNHKIYRDDVLLQTVGVGVEVYYDTTALGGYKYKYEIQAVSSQGESIIETDNVNVLEIITPDAYEIVTGITFTDPTAPPEPEPEENYVFDGTADSWLKIDQTDILDGIVNQSWVVKGTLTGSTTANRSLIGTSTSAVDLRLGTTTDNEIRWRLDASIVTEPGWAEDELEHIWIATYDGTNMKVYEDGTEIMTASSGGFTGHTDGKVAAIGRSRSDMLMIGQINTVQFYNKGLSPAEVTQLQTDITNTPTGLVANFATDKTLTTWTSDIGSWTATNQGDVTLV